MRVALINPSVPAALKKENLGLAYLAACLNQAGHQTRIIDEIAGHRADQALGEFKPDIVGISFMTMYALRAYELTDRIKREWGIPVILGGAHATALPDEAIEHADAIIRGEAEITFPNLLDSGRIEGVVEAQPPTDLDALPMPSRDQLDLNFYATAGEELAGLSYRTLGVITSRGCPFHCDFCVNSKREVPLRFHGPGRVIEEIRYLVQRHHIESIAFYDELMATNRERFAAICEQMIANDLNHLRWECQIHPRALRDDLLPLMKRAGCVQVAIGFESGSQRILDRLHKGANVEQNLEVARRVREVGLRLRGCFVFGAPGETLEDIQKTETFIRAARIDFASMHYLTPYPGTALYDQLKDKIDAAHIPWDKFTTGNPDTFPCNDAIPPAEQKHLFEKLAARLAFRNYRLPDMLRRALKNPRHALHIARKLFRY
jgi:radical SAM superfamily enzyme YgiQ (UPF0313 family)